MAYRKGDLDDAAAKLRQLVAVAPGVAAFRENLMRVEEARRGRSSHGIGQEGSGR